MSQFEQFLAKLGRSEPLSYEEEYALLEAVASGDMLARQRIAESRLRQVASIVWQAGAVSDQILAANAGLLRAIDMYVKHPSKWRDFDACAEEFIKKEIED
jgi:DNA-directed RNA polymerase sigma subunit (sigma70/sigma32)